MKEYEFTLTVRGKGNSKQEAWEDAMSAFDPSWHQAPVTGIDVIAACCSECSVSHEDEDLVYVPSLEDLLCPACDHKRGLTPKAH